MIVDYDYTYIVHGMKYSSLCVLFIFSLSSQIRIERGEFDDNPRLSRAYFFFLLQNSTKSFSHVTKFVF